MRSETFRWQVKDLPYRWPSGRNVARNFSPRSPRHADSRALPNQCWLKHSTTNDRQVKDLPYFKASFPPNKARFPKFL